MKIDKGNPKHWLLLAQQGLCTLLAILIRPFCKKPAKPVVLLYGHQFSGNLKALYTQWERTHRDKFDFYYLSLDPEYGEQLRQDGIKVLQCNRLRDMLTLTHASAMITDHGLHLMVPLVRFTDIVFIDAWHGIPFKGFVPADFRLQHRYDEVWVSSPLLKNVYVEKFGFPEEIVKPLGYARVDKLFRGDPPSVSYRDFAGIPKDKKIVLYAPTWQQDGKGHELFPFKETQDILIQSLSDICNARSAILVVRSHLNASISEKALNNVQYCSMKDFPDTECLLQETDILICDWSSISFDYLALNRPTIFLDVPPPYKNGLSLGKEYRFGKVTNDMASHRAILDQALDDPTAYAKERGPTHARITREVYGDNTDGKAASRQLNRLIGLVRR